MRCVPQGLTYVQYATALRALRIRTCVCEGGTWRAAFHEASRAVRTFGVRPVRYGFARLAHQNLRL